MTENDKIVLWLREAADEVQKAHEYLDFLNVPRESEQGILMTLTARIATLDDLRPRRAR